METKTRYYAAAYQGDTRIPGMDGPPRDTIAHAMGDCGARGYAWIVRAIDRDSGDRELSLDEEYAMHDAEDAAAFRRANGGNEPR